MKTMRPVIAFDLGGTHLRSVVVDGSGKARDILKTRINSFTSGAPPRAVWEEIIASMATFESKVRGEVPDHAPIAISFPGPVKHPSQILDAPTVAGKTVSIPDLRLELFRLTGRPVLILNDISAAAWYFGQRTPDNRLMVVTVSSGIGSKIFDRRHPNRVLDDPPYAGEIGHVTVDYSPDAVDCDCGGRGHIGAIASGRGVERAARRKAQTAPDDFARSACVRTFGATAAHLNNEEHIVPAIRANDPWALALISESTRPLARMLLSVTLAVGLERIIVIGGFALALGETYLQVLRSELREACDYRVVHEYLENLIEAGSAEEEACLLGAAVYAQQMHTI
jgi:predicted NBD/HSP70 family sugar kinase